MADQASIELIRLALNVSASQQRLALENLASASIENAKYKEIDFASVLSQLRSSDSATRLKTAAMISNNWQQIEQDVTVTSFKEVKLDEEVALSLKASGNYQKMVELMNRKMGLMKLAVTGGKG